MINKPWTSLEIELIKRSYSDSDQSTMMILIPDRSYQAIKCKAMKLGVKKNNRGRYLKKPQIITHYQKKLQSGLLTIKGNLTTHRMM